MVHFPISGIDTYFWLPPLVACGISFFTSMTGISGAFLLLPFQMSVLGYVGTGVSPTNLIYNIVAIPPGVLGYVRERRMLWPLTWLMICGMIPGIGAGSLIRLRYLPEPNLFKAFAGCILLYLGTRLLWDARRRRKQDRTDPSGPVLSGAAKDAWRLSSLQTDWRQLTFRFREQEHLVPTLPLIGFSCGVGLVSGIYGVGGGSLMAPVLVTVFRLPVHTIAGAMLMSTFLSSIFGVLTYQWIAPALLGGDTGANPDWLLGLLFGCGGMAGTFLGASAQRWLPARAIKLILAAIVITVAVRYLAAYLLD